MHPRDLAKVEVESFLTHLAVDRTVTPSTHNQALAALVFLYSKVLGVNLPWLNEVVRATRPSRLPTVLTEQEVFRLFAKVPHGQRLVVRLMYGTGMRVLEVVRLRVLDIDFGRCVGGSAVIVTPAGYGQILVTGLLCQPVCVCRLYAHERCTPLLNQSEIEWQ